MSVASTTAALDGFLSLYRRFDVHPLGCPATGDTLKRGHQTRSAGVPPARRPGWPRSSPGAQIAALHGFLSRPCGHPLLHSEWRRGTGRGGAQVHGEVATSKRESDNSSDHCQSVALRKCRPFSLTPALSRWERFHDPPKFTICAPEPTPNPSQEGSGARPFDRLGHCPRPLPLLGGVRGGFCDRGFMGRGKLIPSLAKSTTFDLPEDWRSNSLSQRERAGVREKIHLLSPSPHLRGVHIAGHIRVHPCPSVVKPFSP
jgi:hypothetical protein